MYKCPNKNLPEWKELERVVPEVAYTVWDLNNGYGIDKAPNGESSILFQDLLDHFDGNREAAIKTKVMIYSTSYKTWSNDRDLDTNGEPIIQDVISSPNITYNPEDFTPISQEDMRVINEVTKLYEKIQKGLKDRLNSIKRYTVKNPKVWNQLQTTIQQLANSETEEGIYQFLQHIDESINDSIKFLSKPTKNISAKQIRQLSNDYIGFYKPLMDDIIYLFDTTDIFKDKPNYDTIKELANTLSQQIDSVNNKFINVLKSKGYSMLQQYLTELGMPQNMIQDTINWLDVR